MARGYVYCVAGRATPGIYTLSLHDALPISRPPIDLREVREELRLQVHLLAGRRVGAIAEVIVGGVPRVIKVREDRKSTRLNSSHPSISYAVFCLKKKNKISTTPRTDRRRHS